MSCTADVGAACDRDAVRGAPHVFSAVGPTRARPHSVGLSLFIYRIVCYATPPSHPSISDTRTKGGTLHIHPLPHTAWWLRQSFACEGLASMDAISTDMSHQPAPLCRHTIAISVLCYHVLLPAGSTCYVTSSYGFDCCGRGLRSRPCGRYM